MRHYTSPPTASPQVSWESASLSCGTRLISSVIKINEVLIAVVTHANDCEAQRWGFPLPAANQRVNLGLDVCERYSSTTAAVLQLLIMRNEILNVIPLFWSDLWSTALIYIRISNLNLILLIGLWLYFSLIWVWFLFCKCFWSVKNKSLQSKNNGGSFAIIILK